LTTRSELYTRSESRRAKPRFGWDFALGIFTLGYVLFELFGGMDSPIVSLLVIVVVAWRLVQPHLDRH